MTSKVVAMPGVQVRSRGVEIDKVIEGVVEYHRAEPFDSVVVVARMPDGRIETFSSSGNIDEVIGLLSRAVCRHSRWDGLVEDDE
jgi:hypothetical protein